MLAACLELVRRCLLLLSALRFGALVTVGALLLTTTVPCHGDQSLVAGSIVKIKYGLLRGVLMHLDQEPRLRPVSAYLGVPYASPPTGALRFMPPVTPAHWRGVRLADRLPPLCSQTVPAFNSSRMPPARLEWLRRMAHRMANQSEDCLYLNIYSAAGAAASSSLNDWDQAAVNFNHSHAADGSIGRRRPPRARRAPGAGLPVLVLLTGESYEWNPGSLFDGSVLASFGQAVVVTLNFRLGILGFLPADADGATRGNYGLMDQVAALHWIQENIAQFGGEPGNVTLVGHGHGAACAHLLLLSPMAKGLFRRVVLMSGSALSPWAVARDAPLFGRLVAGQLGCHGPLLLDCMRSRSLHQLQSARYQAPDHLSAFGPIVDGIVVPGEPRLMLHQQRWAGRARPPPELMLGVTRVESPALFERHEELAGISVSRRNRLLRTLVRNLFDYHQQAIFYTLANEYTDWTKPAEQPLQLLDSLLELLGDALVVAPAIESLDHHAALAAAYFYVFTYQRPPVPGAAPRYHQRLGAPHGHDLAFALAVPLVEPRPEPAGHPTLDVSADWLPAAVNRSQQEIELCRQFLAAWINFARHGDPSNSGQQSSPDQTRTRRHQHSYGRWPRYDLLGRQYLQFGWPIRQAHHYHSHRLSVWLSLIPRLHVPVPARSPPQDQQQQDDDAGLDLDQLFYLKHHLLPDHENSDTYDGVVRELSIRIPQSRPWRLGHLRPNLTGLLEHAALLHGTPSPAATPGSPPMPPGPRRQVERPRPPPLPPPASKPPLRQPTRARGNGTANDSDDEAPESYATLVMAAFLLGGALFLLNVAIVVGVYFQVTNRRQRPRGHEPEPESPELGHECPCQQQQAKSPLRSILKSPSPGQGSCSYVLQTAQSYLEPSVHLVPTDRPAEVVSLMQPAEISLPPLDRNHNLSELPYITLTEMYQAAAAAAANQ